MLLQLTVSRCFVVRVYRPVDYSVVPSASSFYVSRVPDLLQDETHPLHVYSGHISSDPEASSLPQTTVSAHIFFVMVKARRTADKERIMFWFNVRSFYRQTVLRFLITWQGGPGCSSFDGLMMEVGPWVLDPNGGLQTREGGWEEYTTMVYSE
jgi:carboxypeptidase D